VALFDLTGEPHVWLSPKVTRETKGDAMNGKKYFIAFAIAPSLGALAPASTAWAQTGGFDFEYQGGFVKPCSLDGVNPAHHPEIFGSPAVAREYGFAQSPDGAWYVSCGAHAEAVISGESTHQGVTNRHQRTALRGPSRKVAKGPSRKVAKSE
jgi:hypothetical protein